ncbi:speckle-type POZ protein-like A [Caerostris extrusa]|uniref:Speckle-type POZ protein-like A n=1 Tax=Caerostris extrusa TaxID=172846 RepID=A0AAV4MCU1_CAEEX|nr:speckle-type POZ protein-like A [Caerostris extrusa]
MRRSDCEAIRSGECFVRTRIQKETLSFQWNIEGFSTIKDKQEVWRDTNVNYPNICLRQGRRKMECLKEDIWFHGLPTNCMQLRSLITKNSLIAAKSEYLPGDVLSLLCVCTFSTGVMQKEIEYVHYGEAGLRIQQPFAKHADDAGLRIEQPVADSGESSDHSTRVLKENMRSLFDDGLLSDVQLRTDTSSFPAHRSILGARSRVRSHVFERHERERSQQRPHPRPGRRDSATDAPVPVHRRRRRAGLGGRPSAVRSRRQIPSPLFEGQVFAPPESRPATRQRLRGAGARRPASRRESQALRARLHPGTFQRSVEIEGVGMLNGSESEISGRDYVS